MALFDRINLNPRERRLLGGLGVVVALLVVLGVPIGMQLLVSSHHDENEELRQALATVQVARSKVHERQARKDAIAHRYARKAPPLAGFIEEKARAQKLEVSDSVDRPDVPQGKRYVERSTTVHLKKAGMYAISKFLESIEQSGNPVAVSRLSIRRRTGEPDSWDVEVGVSAYDRVETPAKPAADSDKDKKP
jgi:general secretion pathway protein M